MCHKYIKSIYKKTGRKKSLLVTAYFMETNHVLITELS